MQIKYMNFSNVTSWTINEGSVIRVTDSLNRVIWEKPSTMQSTYFFVENPNDADLTMQFKRNHNYNDQTDTNPAHNPKFNVYKSTNLTAWNRITDNISATGNTFTVPANSRVYIKAVTEGYAGYDSDCQRDIWTVLNSVWDGGSTPRYFNVGGNIMSLLFGDNFRTATWYNNTNAFINFFYHSLVVDAGNLYMADANNSTYFGVFEKMFQAATSLVTPPQLPATTLGEYCYNKMFMHCTSLTTLPSNLLPATTLVTNCYANMFNDCTYLTTAPALPATTLADYCYENMFYGCQRLTTAPTLPATTLATGSYKQMFYGCYVLNNVTSYAQQVTTSKLDNWLYGTNATGDFYNLGGATYSTGASGIPSGWTVHNTL